MAVWVSGEISVRSCHDALITPMPMVSDERTHGRPRRFSCASFHIWVPTASMVSANCFISRERFAYCLRSFSTSSVTSLSTAPVAR